jgi:hypothetical protein
MSDTAKIKSVTFSFFRCKSFVVEHGRQLIERAAPNLCTSGSKR